MPHWSRFDVLLYAVSALAAVRLLVGMMRTRRDEMVEDVRRQVQAELQAKKKRKGKNAA